MSGDTITSYRQNKSAVDKRRFEVICGVALALFAAILAAAQLGAGRFGGDELIAHNEKTTSYAWFNSKGMKQNLAEGQRDMLKSLLDAGVIDQQKTGDINLIVEKLDKDIKRYGQEKKEILLGSAALGKENWIQEIDGQMGKVIGAKQWEKNAKDLGDACDYFDFSTLFLQMCLVIGAISIVLQAEKVKWWFFGSMCLLGTIGSGLTLYAYMQALKIPTLG